MKKEIYTLKAVTNMHVGSGDNTMGVIDKLVQKDVNTGLPTIHSSSLKGGLRQFFKTHNKDILPVFGMDNSGLWQFMSADMLSRPLRSNKAPYFNATSPKVIKSFMDKAIELGFDKPEGIDEILKIDSVEKGKPIVFNAKYEGAIIEENNWEAIFKDNFSDSATSFLTRFFGENIVLVNNDDFIELDLPVIARNYLENGESKNLWYEEVVPYDTRFVFFVLRPEKDENNYFEIFKDGINNLIQIGANASIGYGLSSIKQAKII